MECFSSFYRSLVIHSRVDFLSLFNLSPTWIVFNLLIFQTRPQWQTCSHIHWSHAREVGFLDQRINVGKVSVDSDNKTLLMCCIISDSNQSGRRAIIDRQPRGRVFCQTFECLPVGELRSGILCSEFASLFLGMSPSGDTCLSFPVNYFLYFDHFLLLLLFYLSISKTVQRKLTGISFATVF